MIFTNNWRRRCQNCLQDLKGGGGAGVFKLGGVWKGVRRGGPGRGLGGGSLGLRRPAAQVCSWRIFALLMSNFPYNPSFAVRNTIILTHSYVQYKLPNCHMAGITWLICVVSVSRYRADI